MKNFKELKIWQQGMSIVEEVYRLSILMPKEEKYGLISQIQRAAVSIPSNIAEGASRDSKKEQTHYLRVTLGSLFELETQLIIIHRLKLIDTDNLKIIDLLTTERKMIYGYMKAISQS